eukprot:633176-Pelagomonas_calceolata.AAC.1
MPEQTSQPPTDETNLDNLIKQDSKEILRASPTLHGSQLLDALSARMSLLTFNLQALQALEAKKGLQSNRLTASLFLKMKKFMEKRKK